MRAISPHASLRRALAQRFVARVASQDELVRLTAAGVTVQNATQDPDPDFDDLFEPSPQLADHDADALLP